MLGGKSILPTIFEDLKEAAGVCSRRGAPRTASYDFGSWLATRMCELIQ